MSVTQQAEFVSEGHFAWAHTLDELTQYQPGTLDRAYRGQRPEAQPGQ